jgi:hypothetical protein
MLFLPERIWKKRQRPSSHLCSFCIQHETNDHLFFTSLSPRLSGVLGKALGTNLVPDSFWQAMVWFHNFIPHLEKFYIVILASVVWAIWNTRNRVTFDKYIIKISKCNLVFSPSLCWFTGQVSRRMQLRRTNCLRVPRRWSMLRLLSTQTIKLMLIRAT